MANAFSWCENDRPEFDRAIITTNPHSLNQYRINFVDKNSADFAKTFSCHKGQTMVSDDACRVW
jgi:endothelin-converting enzyme/putative endopeptidase